MRQTLIAIVLTFGFAACSGSEPKQSGTPAEGAAAVAAAMDKIGAGAVNAISNPAAPVEIVADDALVKRIIDHDKSLTALDVQGIFSKAKNTPYVKDFEALSATPMSGVIEFRSADDKYTGVIVGSAGTSEGHQFQVYSVGLYTPPDTPGDTDDSDGVTSWHCFERVAAVNLALRDGQPFERPRPPSRGKPSEEQIEEERIFKNEEFSELDMRLNSRRNEQYKDFRKRGAICQT